MKQKRLPVAKSNEELLKDLELTEITSIIPITEEKIQSEDTILTFLRFYNIEPGKIRIKNRYLYKLYKEFTENPTTSKSFSLSIGYYLPFKTERNGLDRISLINQKVLNLSEKALELIKKGDKPRHKAVSSKNHFDNFLKKYNIEPGTDENWIWISSKIFYNLYDKWTYEIKRKQGLTLKTFRKLCNACFIHKEDRKSLWYKVNNSICQHLSSEMNSELKARNSLINEKEKKQT